MDTTGSGSRKIVKVKGTNNMADILTKHVDNDTLTRHCRHLDSNRSNDRHELNPAMATDTNSKQDSKTTEKRN